MAVRVIALKIQRGPPQRVRAIVENDDAPFRGQIQVEITDATTLATIFGANVLTRIVNEVNTKVAGRSIT